MRSVVAALATSGQRCPQVGQHVADIFACRWAEASAAGVAICQTGVSIKTSMQFPRIQCFNCGADPCGSFADPEPKMQQGLLETLICQIALSTDASGSFDGSFVFSQKPYAVSTLGSGARTLIIILLKRPGSHHRTPVQAIGLSTH